MTPGDRIYLPLGERLWAVAVVVRVGAKTVTVDVELKDGRFERRRLDRADIEEHHKEIDR